MYKENRYEIRIGGFGGQGFITIGNILGEAISLYEGINTVSTHSYGPESRGGACKLELVISKTKNDFTNVLKTDILVALSVKAHENYIKEMKEEGSIILENKLKIKASKLNKWKIYCVPTVKLAMNIGSIKYQNLVILCIIFVLIKNMVEKMSLQKAIINNFPPKPYKDNIKAFGSGINYL